MITRFGEYQGQQNKIAKIVLLLLIMALFLNGCRRNVQVQISEQLELGEKYLTEGNYEEAIVAFNKVIELNPKKWAGYQKIAEIYFSQNQYSEAAGILNQAMIHVDKAISAEEQDNIAKMYTLIAENDVAEGDIEKAIKYYEWINRIHPGQVTIEKKISRVI